MAETDDIVALPAIETDELDPTRQYIPLPGGWEVQTRGRGSSYRLLDRKTGERRSILTNDPGFIENFVTRMALEVHAATSTALAERGATIERLEGRCAAYKGQVEAGAAEIERLTKERDEALADLKTAAEDAAYLLPAKVTAERERDEARAEVERKDAALRLIESWEPATQEMTLAHQMAEVARAALTAKGGENAEG